MGQCYTADSQIKNQIRGPYINLEIQSNWFILGFKFIGKKTVQSIWISGEEEIYQLSGFVHHEPKKKSMTFPLFLHDLVQFFQDWCIDDFDTTWSSISM